MAIYEFVCESCGLSKIVHRPMAKRNDDCFCDGCNPPKKMDRLIGNPGLVFKGKGFYKTDYQIPKEMKKQALKEKKAREEGTSGYTEI